MFEILTIVALFLTPLVAGRVLNFFYGHVSFDTLPYYYNHLPNLLAGSSLVFWYYLSQLSFPVLAEVILKTFCLTFLSVWLLIETDFTRKVKATNEKVDYFSYLKELGEHFCSALSLRVIYISYLVKVKIIKAD